MTTLATEGANSPSNTGQPAGGGPSIRIEGRTPLQLAWIRLRRDRVSMAAGVTIILLILMAIFAPVLAHIIGHGPNFQDRVHGLTESGIPTGPTSRALLGFDALGRDILVRIIYGARISLFIGVVSTGISLIIGVVIGLFAGYYGGKVDTVLSGLMDVVLSFPFLLTALTLVAIFSPSVYISIEIIAFFGWVYIARIVRGQVLSLREKEFIEAARSLGASDLRIMFGDVLPNLVAPIIVYATLLIPTNILAEASLSFLGLGPKPPAATWGQMLAESQDSYTVAWWFFLFPGLALLITVLAFNLLGDGLRDALDPRANQTLGK
ncbi:MAG: peptide/nickel transport system permease protein [Frankiaceae bacterium]|jgi:peptide/nickel transport system permease protein|nr:peptide/nickel transport system permease protein [Frankiaceae bacterium]